MTKFKTGCNEVINSSKIVCSENRSKVTFINEKKIKITKVRVDGCQIIDGLKCDYLIIANEVEHYVELKGEDIQHAFKQIKRTIELLSQDPKRARKNSYVICTRSPLTSPEIQNERLKFRRDMNSDLTVKSITLDVKV